MLIFLFAFILVHRYDLVTFISKQIGIFDCLDFIFTCSMSEY